MIYLPNSQTIILYEAPWKFTQLCFHWHTKIQQSKFWAVGLVSLFNGVLTIMGYLKQKVIPVEQRWYCLTLSWELRGTYIPQGYLSESEHNSEIGVWTRFFRGCSRALWLLRHGDFFPYLSDLLLLLYTHKVRFRYERFINFLISVHGDTRRATQFFLCWPPPPPKARRILWCLRSQFISTGRDQKNLTAAATVENSTLCLNAETKLSATMVQSQLTLFQNPHILRTISSGHDIIPTPVPFPVWGFIMTMVIVISFAHERKTAHSDYAPELFTRIVQSLTKLNDKI